MASGMSGRDLAKAALRGEPSYVWRAGQERRLKLIQKAAGERAHGVVLDCGCGVGAYLERLAPGARQAIGLEYDAERAADAAHALQPSQTAVAQAAAEQLPLANGSVDLILSHEVLEHVADDRQGAREMVRVLRSPGGRLMLFAPNRRYPFETHGIYWRGRYRFGNIPLVNYLPDPWRNRLAPHVRAYRRRELEALFHDLPVRIVSRTILFGAYDNIIARWPATGRLMRAMLQGLERTPLRLFGLSHFWVIERR
jgi:SAM-dependent methyltransferase